MIDKSELAAAQAIAVVLEEFGAKMELTKLAELLQKAVDISLQDVGDCHFSKGIDPESTTFKKYFKVNIVMIDRPGDGELSDYDVELLQKVCK